MSEGAVPVEGTPAPSTESSVDGVAEALGASADAAAAEAGIDTTPASDPVAEAAALHEQRWNEFRDSAPVEYKAQDWWQNVNGPDDLFRQFAAGQKMIGEKGVIPPKEGDAEDFRRFVTEMGCPESADKYDLGDFTPPEGIGWNDGVQNEMLAAFHEMGMPSANVQKGLEAYAESQRKAAGIQMQAEVDRKAASTAQLKQEYGPMYEPMMETLGQALGQLPAELISEVETLEMKDGSKLADSPVLMKVLDNWVKRSGLFQEERAVEGGFVAPAGFTPDGAIHEISRLQSQDEAFKEAWMDPMHLDHEEAKAKLAGLYKIAYGNESALGNRVVSSG